MRNCLLLNPSSRTLVTLFDISLYFSNNLSFIKKYIYLVSSKLFLYALIFGSTIHKGITFFRISLVPNEIFKTFFLPKNVFSSYYKTRPWCWWYVCFSAPISPNIIAFLPILYTVITIFCFGNTLPPSVKLVFVVNL